MAISSFLSAFFPQITCSLHYNNMAVVKVFALLLLLRFALANVDASDKKVIMCINSCFRFQDSCLHWVRMPHYMIMSNINPAKSSSCELQSEQINT